ncbi:hypothetical protein G6O69_16085 [Pseudenhygromyxa sp. WMMC2535]|uniref:hypothetical protein n=1 Tax=Pseudenhygromyxa sp. WMMC2535 TaxID=2712867 RepID=UPI0015542A15|nr:hypothetical protein [Pseudenhygromyxa sp. WMMC2535]NVB39363.1 hypothetical protein [Pseudenhygromyxa sp. WMMC2535]
MSSCKEEDTRLFDEEGVWALESYSLLGTGYQSIDQLRKNLFLLNFSSGDGVVAAANCHSEGGGSGVNEANCVDGANSTWDCRCFAYEYDESRMVWQEFTPGDAPPAVGFPDNAADGGDEGDEEGSGAHEILLEATGATQTYEFASLPEGLFDSDGSISKHVFQKKADTIWTAADIDEDGTPDLDECAMSCFPSLR